MMKAMFLASLFAVWAASALPTTPSVAASPAKIAAKKELVALSIFDQSLTKWNQIVDIADGSGVNYRTDISAALESLDASGALLYPKIEWMSERGQPMLKDSSLVLSASEEEIRLLLGGLDRAERFAPGIIGRAIMNNIYRNAYKRLKEI